MNGVQIKMTWCGPTGDHQVMMIIVAKLTLTRTMNGHPRNVMKIRLRLWRFVNGKVRRYHSKDINIKFAIQFIGFKKLMLK